MTIGFLLAVCFAIVGVARLLRAAVLLQQAVLTRRWVRPRPPSTA
jgi:hypothetical protein